MLEYQKRNKITRECVGNTQFLLKNSKDYVAKAVVVFVKDVCGVHMVPLKNNRIVEVSYEFIVMKNKIYCRTLEKALKLFDKVHRSRDNPETRKELIDTFNIFEDYEKRMNSGEFITADFDNYERQRMFVNLHMRN